LVHVSWTGTFSQQKLTSIGKQAGIIRKAQDAQKTAKDEAKKATDMKPPK
jgi:hypothetical protein